MDLMESSESQHVIGIYNILARTLIEYEVVWAASWFRDIHKVKVGLERPLIIQDWKTGHLHLLQSLIFNRHSFCNRCEVPLVLSILPKNSSIWLAKHHRTNMCFNCR